MNSFQLLAARLKNALSHMQLAVLILMLMSPFLSVSQCLKSLDPPLVEFTFHRSTEAGGRCWDYAGSFISLTSSVSCSAILACGCQIILATRAEACKVSLLVQYAYTFNLVKVPDKQANGTRMFFKQQIFFDSV